MNKNQKGFSAIEILFFIIILFVLGLIGLFVWHSHHNSSTVITTPKTITNSTHTIHPSGWSTYKSTHSSIAFSYPSSWEKINNKLSTYELEDVSFDGPNNFQMNFILQTKHVNPAQQCALDAYDQPAIPVSDKYDMIPEESPATATTNNANLIYLVSSNTNYLPGRSCGLSWLYMSAGSDVEFQFVGYYKSSSNTPRNYPITLFLNQPEVKTAKQIFGTLKS